MHIFSYGSLTNFATHALPQVARARLHGWRRAWRHSPLRQVAYLTILPDPTSVIDGLVLEVPDAERADLSTREAAYELVDVSDTITTDRPTRQVLAWSIAPGQHRDPTPQTPVLLSYIDVVVQGYLQVFGDEGVAGFFASTSGWDAPVLQDRTAPLYPRHQRLSPDEHRLVDRMLRAHNVTLLARMPEIRA